MSKKTIEDISVKGKRVLVRVDFNVPLDDEGNITDETRIKAALPTINYLLDNSAKVILCSHLGRPKGEFNMKYSLAPVAKRLKEIYGEDKVTFASDVIGPSAQEAVANLKEGHIVLLENLRFHKEEEKNDPEFAKKLASYADIYVNDAFGTAHRAHASTEGVTKYLPSVAGFLIGKELSIMGGALEHPQRPFIAILGGKKVSDKIGVINNLLEEGKSVLAEGAQGTMLDVDFGSYPFVTSSNTICAGACTGLGVAPGNIGEVYGIFKAYCTRVGAGPFPTELFDETGEKLCALGHEFGAVTGRKRRCGWIDLVALKYAVMINGVSQLIMMKSDVLDSFDTIKACVAYKINGEETDEFPFDICDGVEPVYVEIPGWKTDMTQMTSEDEFPEEFNAYVSFLEEELGVPVKIVSVGPDREQTIIRYED
mgnify:CR=1 FL=1